MNRFEDYRNNLLEPSKYPGKLVPIDPSGLELPEFHPLTLGIRQNIRYNLTPQFYGKDKFLLNKPLFNAETGKPVKKFWEKLTLLHDSLSHAIGGLVQHDLSSEENVSKKKRNQFIVPSPNRIGEQKAQVNGSYYYSMLLDGEEPTYEKVFEDVQRSLKRLENYNITPPKISKKTLEVWIEHARQSYAILAKNNHLPTTLIRTYFNRLP